jgi:hypothetical protein
MDNSEDLDSLLLKDMRKLALIRGQIYANIRKCFSERLIIKHLEAVQNGETFNVMKYCENVDNSATEGYYRWLVTYKPENHRVELMSSESRVERLIKESEASHRKLMELIR